MKKNIKALLVLIIIGSILLVLTGCGDKENTKKEEPKKVVETKPEIVDQTKPEIVDDKQSKAEISIGEWNGDVYTNDFLGLRYNLPTGWKYASNEEIAEMMSISTELLNDNQKAAMELGKLTSVYYIYAQDTNTGNNVSVVTEKVIGNITMDDLIDGLKSELLSIETIEYEIGETSTEKIGNIEAKTLTVEVKTSGIELIQKYYFYEVDKYIVDIIVTSVTGEAGINEIIECFE